jgi:hypothetical protein
LSNSLARFTFWSLFCAASCQSAKSLTDPRSMCAGGSSSTRDHPQQRDMG